MTKRKTIIIGICAIAVLAAAGGYLLVGGKRSGMRDAGGSGAPGGMGRAGSPGEAGDRGEQAAVTIVKAAAPIRGDLSLTTGLTGTVEAADVVYVYAKTSGDVTDVKVKAGDQVTQGQILCEIDTEQVESAKNSMDSAQVNLTQAQNNLSRMQVLYNGGDLSVQEYEQYANAVKTAQLQYESARLAYRRQVEYSTVTAPIDGKIESCDVEIYDRVSQSSQLCVIGGEGDSRITFYVTQRMMKNLREGDELEIAKNGIIYKGTISEISSMVDESSGLFKVKAQIEGTDEIAIGSTVKLNLVTERTQNAMLVPVDAVYYSGGDGYVYVYEDGIARMRGVEIGLYDSQYAEILSGISEDEQIVSTWSSHLYEGAQIRLQDEGEGQEERRGEAGQESMGEPKTPDGPGEEEAKGQKPEGQKPEGENGASRQEPQKGGSPKA